jgi:predicted RecA/RadA family phage recombinase
MAQTPAIYVDGDQQVIDYTPGADVAAGDVLVLGSLMVCMAPLAVKDGALGALACGGTWDAPKVQEALSRGDRLYWDDNGSPYGGTALSGAMTKDPTKGPLAGWCIADAASTDERVRMRLVQPCIKNAT